MVTRLLLLPVLAVVLALFLAAPANASRWHGGPFSPAGRVVDHTVVLDIELDHPKRKTVRTIKRRGDWARSSDGEERGGRVSWVNLRSGVSAERYSDASGESVVVRKESDRLYADYFDLQPRPTGRTDHLLGETCRVWEVWRSKGTGMRHESCVTDDGVELWYRTMNDDRVGESGRAISVVRRRLRDAEVKPPTDLLSRDRFLRAARRLSGGYVSPIPDHVVRYGEYPAAAETRRSGTWSGKFGGLPGARTLDLRDDASGANLRLARDGESGGLDSLHLFLPRVAVTVGRAQMPDLNGKTSIVLGELCWPPLKPAPVDGQLVYDGYTACLTADGILLKWSHAGRIFTGAVATALVRRKVRFDEVFPRDTPLSNRAWGLDG